MTETWVALYTQSCLVTGQLDTNGRRLSDCLNDRMTGFVVIDKVTYYDMLGDGAEKQAAVSLTVRKDSILIAVPEDSPDPLRPRVRTNVAPLVLGFDAYHVRGHLHRQPGDAGHLIELFSNPATRPFFPVSDSSVRCLFNSRYDADVPLALVNTKRLDFWSLEGDD